MKDEKLVMLWSQIIVVQIISKRKHENLSKQLSQFEVNYKT